MEVRLNIGCGDYPIPGYFGIDSSKDSRADLVASVPPIPYEDETVDEIYAGHFLEHLDYDDGQWFLGECHRVLKLGGTLGIVVPDMREVMRRYVMNERAPMEFPAGTHLDLSDLHDACGAIIFSTMQPSHHKWAYDLETLARAMQLNGFHLVAEIDRMTDPRLGTGQWYQCGLQGMK